MRLRSREREEPPVPCHSEPTGEESHVTQCTTTEDEILRRLSIAFNCGCKALFLWPEQGSSLSRGVCPASYHPVTTPFAAP